MPKTIGRFSVLRRIGEGGMAVVVEAIDPNLNRHVAIKLLRVNDDVARARLLREAQAMAKIKHPNVVPIYEVGSNEGEVFVVMELIERAKTLSAWLLEKKRTWQSKLSLLIEAGYGLAAVHEAGLIHRDFKLENIVVGLDGRPRLVDLGLAQWNAAPQSEDSEAEEENAQRLTKFGRIMGTPNYMSPEQFLGQDLTPASDQFSFCVATYRALFGVLPFEGSSFRKLRNNVLTGAPKTPPKSKIPLVIQHAILQGLSAVPEKRWASLKELLQVLEAELMIDPDADIRRGRYVRLLFAVLITGVSINRIRLSLGRTAQIHAEVLRNHSAVTVAGFLFLILIFHKKVFSSAYNRRAMTLLVSIAVGMLLHRQIAIQLNTDVQSILAADAIILATTSAVASIAHDNRLWIAVGFGALGSFLCSISQPIAVIAFPVILSLVATLLMLMEAQSLKPERSIRPSSRPPRYD